jgi:hypothetical protein
MNLRRHGIRGVASLVAACCLTTTAAAVTLDFVGSQANLDNGFFPGGQLPYVTAYWRSDTEANIYAASNESPNRYYGTAGYALFATTFTYPDANLLGGEPNLNPDGSDPLYPNIISTPSWVSASQPLATRMAGGYGYSLIDDPVLQHGVRHWTFDGVNYPDAGSGAPNTGQNPYVKMGFLDGGDIFGNNPTEEPTGRWAFTVGADAPAAFRIGVMTGGGDSENFAPSEVYLQQFEGTTPVGTPLGSGALSGTLKDRFVDMHFFDVIGAEEGDVFAIGVMAGPNSFGNAGVAGISFDVLTDVAVDDADFDGNGVVDGADFLIWQRGSGAAGGPEQGDANNDAIVNADDLEIWKAQFGTGAATVAAGAVPEPAATTLAIIGILGAASRRKR